MDLFRQAAINSRRPGRYGRPFTFVTSLLDAGSRLPVLMQSQRSDCGLVCLAMVAGFHGRHIDEDWIRTRQLYSERGVTVSGLMAAAEGLKLQARGVRLEPEELKQLNVPAILHWDMDHFVVLKCCRRKDVVVHDPAVGKRSYSFSEL
ncbi:MAG: cysteine peptidase family C39 domain-containing protein, partial [Pseudohongiellaceae bacterium]